MAGCVVTTTMESTKLFFVIQGIHATVIRNLDENWAFDPIVTAPYVGQIRRDCMQVHGGGRCFPQDDLGQGMVLCHHQDAIIDGGRNQG